MNKTFIEIIIVDRTKRGQEIFHFESTEDLVDFNKKNFKQIETVKNIIIDELNEVLRTIKVGEPKKKKSL